MAAEGKDMTNADASDFVQEVLPFPLAQDLLLVSKQSLQSALSETNKPNQDEGSIHELGSRSLELPFQLFTQGSVVNGVEAEDVPQRLAAGDVDGSLSVLPPEYSLSEDSYLDSAGVGDVSEKNVGERIALSEGPTVQQGDESEGISLGKLEILDSFSESRTRLGAELLDVNESGAVPGYSDVNGLTVEEVRVTGDSAVSLREEVLFEGLTLVNSPSESPGRRTVGLGLGEVPVVVGQEKVIDDSGRVEVKVASVAKQEILNEMFKENEVSQRSHTGITHFNGIHDVETLGEILLRDHREEVSREIGKATGLKTSSNQSIASDYARIVSDSMSSTSKAYQGNSDSVPPRALKPALVANSDGNDVASHRSSTSSTNIVGDILYNIAVGDEEGRSRQRILAFAAKRYAANVERNPEDHDALYNWALVLQESADNAGPEVGPLGKDSLLEEACNKYEAATQLCSTLHEAYYNWAIAISDRAKIRGRAKEAEGLWKQACDKYDRAVQLSWNSPQALNNWGLALQELGAIVALKEKCGIVKKAIRKFRAAIRLRFDFHRAIYNLGTVLYGLGEDVARTGRKLTSKDLTPADLYSLSAIYIAAAHSLKPDYALPLPYLRAGWLRIPPAGDSLAPHSEWLRLWFVLDHEALYEIEKVDRKPLAHSYSRRSSTVTSESNTCSFASRPSVLRVEMEEIVYLSPTADLSLPPGGGFYVDTAAGPQYLVAETWDGMDAWVDAIRLVYTIYAQGKRDALANVLVV